MIPVKWQESATRWVPGLDLCQVVAILDAIEQIAPNDRFDTREPGHHSIKWRKGLGILPKLDKSFLNEMGRRGKPPKRNSLLPLGEGAGDEG